MKTVCIYHSIDLDGQMSAAIVKHWFVKQHPKGQINKHLINEEAFDYENVNIDFIGYNYGDSIPDLSEYDNIIMCDISFPKETMLELANKYDVRFKWIDHHQPKINEVSKYLVENKAPTIDGLTTIEGGPKFAACELTWQHFFYNEPMPEIVRLLGRYDCFDHKGTDEEQKVLEFQYGARQCISNYEEAYIWLTHSLHLTNWSYDLDSPENVIWEKGMHIYQYLCIEAKQVYKNGFEMKLTVINKIPDIKELGFKNASNQRNYKFICINKERFNPINFGIDYHKDGYDGAACFYYDGVRKVWAFSLYNDNGDVDCSVIAKQYGGGGHKGAAGFIITNINKIFNNV